MDETEVLRNELEEIKEGLRQLGPSLEQVVSGFDERLENVERLHANLAMAYTELAASMETVIAEIMSPRSEEEREQFRQDLYSRHMATLEMIQQVTREAANNDPEDTLSSTVSDVAKERANSSANEDGN